MKRDNAYDDVEELRPEPGYTDPGRPIYNTPRGSVFTSGTLNEALTGNYYSYRPDLSLSDSRPISHGKSWGNDKTATVARGQLAADASRGVGQPTIDGFITGNAALRQQFNDDIKQAVMQEFIRQAVVHQQEMAKFRNKR